MNVDEHIAKLEALLARVRSRSRVPHDAGPMADLGPLMRSRPLDLETPVGAFHPSPLPPPISPPAAPPNPIAPMRPKYSSRPEFPSQLFAPRSSPPSSNIPLESSLHQTLSEALAPQGRAPLRPEPSRVRAVDPPVDPPPMEVIELEIDPDPSEGPPPVSGPSSERARVMLAAEAREVRPDEPSGPLPADEPLESRSRLVSAPPVSPEQGYRDEATGHVPSDPTIEVAAAEVSQTELDALEADRAPTSSRRPISMEEKMNEPDDDIAPLHIAPPESGSLPAASPAFELSFDAAKPPPAAEAVVARLAHEVTRAEPPGRADVAIFVGQAPGARAPKTFGDLLEDALSL